jgi:hypothetical protein
MGYLYDACDQISDFCHQQLLNQGMTKRAGKIIEEFKDLVFPAGYEPGKKRVGLLSL